MDFEGSAPWSWHRMDFQPPNSFSHGQRLGEINLLCASCAFRPTHQEKLDIECLSTLFCEVEAILNSRPLTSIGDATDSEPLTPAHFLMRKILSPQVLTHIGDFQRSNLFHRCQWKQVQYMSQQVWV
jgi:hypothetical protein